MRTIYFKNQPKINYTYSVCGPKESEGSIAEFIDEKSSDDMFGEKTFEKAECKCLYDSFSGLLDRAKLKDNDIDAIISGDLLNQIFSSTFAIRNFDTGYLGIYNACATFSEALIIGATLIDGKYLNKVICGTSSHFSAAERQYRYPLELGSTRPPLSQWTVTGAGSCLISRDGEGVKIVNGTIGKIVDFGVSDTNDMGAAMSPACADTLISHFENTKTSPNDYDLIVTGDLGAFGSRIFKHLVWERGYDIEGQHVDCGELIYNIKEDEYQGGSGAGCSSLVFTSYLYRRMRENKINKILLLTTGALLSSISAFQGETIPGIAHAVTLEI